MAERCEHCGVLIGPREDHCCTPEREALEVDGWVLIEDAEMLDSGQRYNVTFSPMVPPNPEAWVAARLVVPYILKGGR